MSFILDALRKSEARRRKGEGPNLNEGPAGGDRADSRRRHRRWLGGGLTLVAVLVFAGSAWIGRDLISGQFAQWTGSAPAEFVVPSQRPLLADQIAQPPAPMDRALADARERRDVRRPEPTRPADGDDRRQRPAGDDSEERALPRERIVTDPDQIEAELARRMTEEQQREDAEKRAGASASSLPQRRRQAPLDPARVAEIERQVAEAEARRIETERAAQREADEAARLAELAATPIQPGTDVDPEQPAVRAEPGQPWQSSTSAREYVRRWELPLSIRRNMPDLRLTIHVYAADEAQRFVLVNGERFVVGDQLGEGARLVDIRREGAVVDFRDYRFLLEP